ncbi:MAG: hypothetical protein PHV74_04090 [Dehalococcoidia bacterium]|nr:hypothetical protein [Dehalococcoidia bacterium]
MNEIIMERKRRLMGKIDVQMVAFPDRIEIRGCLPAQTPGNRWAPYLAKLHQSQIEKVLAGEE